VAALDPTDEAAVMKIADAVGALIEHWGFKRNMGRVWAVLYLEQSPLSAADLGERLSLSSGAISMLLAELVQWGVIKKAWVPGERRDHYEAETSIWKMVSRVLRERELRWIQDALEQFAAADAALAAGSSDRSERRGRHRQPGGRADPAGARRRPPDRGDPVGRVGRRAADQDGGRAGAHRRRRRQAGPRMTIEVAGLSKHFRVHRRPPGLAAAVRSLWHRRYDTVKAVDDISFTIARGERVGFLGPNGAGKTTTMKVLSGLLHPTAGTVRVEGHQPFRREPDFLRRITLVMGQKQQLLWDLPPSETYALNRAVFGVDPAQAAQTLGELTELLGLAGLTDKPTRQLSLGERMKCELAAALLHRPTTLFLDEPTIGLDVAMQVTIRDFIRDYNQRHDATVLLTSHYMDDVVALCPRVIVIDGGRLIHDGDLRALVKTMIPDKLVSFTGGVPADEVARLGEVVKAEGGRTTVRVPEARLREVVSHVLDRAGADLAVEDPPLEDVMRKLFKDKRASAPAPAGEPPP
jgi:ABC-2 type transport system ATP-binding protein